MIRTFTAMLVAGLAPGAAAAIPLEPGEVVFPTGTTADADPRLAGVVIEDGLIPFRIDPDPTTPLTDLGGDVQNRVVRSDLTGDLSFEPRIRDTFNAATASFDITALSLSGFGDFATDVDFALDGLGDDGPTSVLRSEDGETLTFQYDDPLTIAGLAPDPQEESLFLSIITDAPSFRLTGQMTIFGVDPAAPDDLLSVSIGGLAVPAPIPVPAAGWALGLGLAGLGAIRLRYA